MNGETYLEKPAVSKRIVEFPSCVGKRISEMFILVKGIPWSHFLSMVDETHFFRVTPAFSIPNLRFAFVKENLGCKKCSLWSAGRTT